MRDQLVNSQSKNGHETGSWSIKGGHNDRGGRLYTTSMATMILEVYYRHLPIYRKQISPSSAWKASVRRAGGSNDATHAAGSRLPASFLLMAYGLGNAGPCARLVQCSWASRTTCAMLLQERRKPIV